MRIHSFQHVPFEDIGSIANDIQKLGHQHTCTHWYKGEQPPKVADIDLLIVMGGPMGACDEKIYPWLADEKGFIADAIRQGKKILGICLGAQLIAAVLGAEVKRNPHKEIGWFPLSIPEANKHHPLAQILSKSSQVFHWHGDTFDLPANATLVASSAACTHQAFVINHQIVGFQFHLETTKSSAQALIENCRDDLDNSTYVQTEQKILENEIGFEEINFVMRKVFNYIIAI